MVRNDWSPDYVVVKHNAFNRSLPRNPQRTLRGLALMAEVELDRHRLQRQPNHAATATGLPFSFSFLLFVLQRWWRWGPVIPIIYCMIYVLEYIYALCVFPL